MTRSDPRIVVASFGSPYRLDDGVGPRVASSVPPGCGAIVEGPFSDPLDMLGVWDDADLAIVVDAVRSGARPGSVSVIWVSVQAEPTRAEDDRATPGTSTHGIGLAGTVRLARAIGRAPRRLAVVGVEGERFGTGEGLSSAVEAAVPDALARVVELIRGA